jgi:type V secretory pathway adhesin AidA
MTLRSPHRPGLPRGRAALAALAALGTLAVATACGDGGSPGNAASTASGSPTASATGPTATPSRTPTASPTPAPGPPSTGRTPQPTLTLPTVRPSPRPSGTTLVVDGVARPGVEAGCTVLAGTDGRTWLLLGANGGTPDQPKIPLGVPIRVRGVQVDQIVSYCQQGTPLEVVEVTRR